MSYNGSGTFQINSSGQPVITGTVISSTAFNALTADLATGLSTAITKDGQTTTTARITFAQGVSSTLVTDATSATTGSIITAGGISTQKALWVGTTTTLVGTATTAAITASGTVTINAATALAINGATPSLTMTDTTWAAGSYFQPGVNSGGTGAGNYFLYNVPTGKSHSWAVNNASKMILDSSGNVGIGTSPGIRLDVLEPTLSQTAKFRSNSASGPYINLNASGTDYVYLGCAKGINGGALADGMFTTATAANLIFGINGSEKARFDTSGNLLVGTTDSTYRSGSSGFVKAVGFITKDGGSKALGVSNAVSNILSIGSYLAPACFLLTWKNTTSLGGSNAQWGSMLVTIVGGTSAFTLGTKATCEYASYRGDPSVTFNITSSGGTSYLTAYCNNASCSSTLTYGITQFYGNDVVLL